MTERKKSFLRRYKKNCSMIERLVEKRDMINGRIIGLNSPKLSDMPKGGTPVSKEELIAEKLEIEERIERLKKRGVIYKAEILKKIDELDDTRYAEILESYFIECKEFGEIAEENNYTIRHVFRLYADAINELSLECP